jgi:hypothetical protein
LPFLPTSLVLPLLLPLPTLLLLTLRRCRFAGAAKFASTAAFAGATAFAAAFTGIVAAPLVLCHCCLCWLCCNPAATFAGGSPLGLPLVMLEGHPLVFLERSSLGLSLKKLEGSLLGIQLRSWKDLHSGCHLGCWKGFHCVVGRIFTRYLKHFEKLSKMLRSQEGAMAVS